MERKELSDLLGKYCRQPALSGYERKMAELFRQEIRPYCDEVEQDRAGNVIGTIAGTDPEAPKVMVMAHLDNIGFMVKQILPSGLMKLERVGDSADKVLQGAGMVVANDRQEYFPGVIATQSYGANTLKDRATVDPLSSLLLDIGLMSGREVRELGIGVGDPVMYEPNYLPMAANDRVIGTFLEGRCGCTAVTDLAQRLKEDRPKCTVYLVGSVWQKFNFRGGVIAARAKMPEIVICVGPAFSSDTNEMKGTGNVRLGGGPAVSLFNFHGGGTLNGCIPQRELVDLALRTSRESGIPMQRSAGRGMISDTAYIQVEGTGINCIDINIPVRYIHSPAEAADLKDVEAAAGLICGMLQRIDRDYPMDRY